MTTLTIKTETSDDYSYTYPKGFFDLCGSLDEEIIPEDLPLEKQEFEV